MKVSIASDHAGFNEKEELVAYLQEKGYEVCNRGPENDDRVDYPDYAAKVARDVQEGTAERGVLICGTGIGMAMTANRFKGIRAANVTTPEFAALTRDHNDANIICLSARFVDESVNKEILDTFFSAEFGGGRHAQRIAKIDSVAEENS